MNDDYENLRKIFEPHIGKELCDLITGRSSDPATFLVTYACGNCGKRSNIRFKKGTLAPDSGIKCPNCETRRTVKTLG